MINLFNINNYKVDTSQFNNHLHGSIVQDFEKSFAKYVGAKYACSVSSATNAIFLVFEGTQEKVIIPSMLPPVVNNALLKAGCSIEYEDNVEWVGDSYKLHEFTNYKVIDSAQKVKKNQFKIEANSEDLMIFSFYPTKPVGSMDGGIIVSDDYDKIKYYKEATINGMSFSKNNWERKIKFPGWKMYMNSFQAFIALQNLKKLESKMYVLNALRKKYNKALGYENTSDHLYRINVQNQNNAIEIMKEDKITCGIHYAANHLNPVYSFSNKYFLPKTESESKTTLSIPYNEKLTELQADHIISVVKNKLR
tara:strand:+ start:2753 stop:3676 length:924 start_codon:yes stop_codon:yes gene_type:complete